MLSGRPIRADDHHHPVRVPAAGAPVPPSSPSEPGSPRSSRATAVAPRRTSIEHRASRPSALTTKGDRAAVWIPAGRTWTARSRRTTSVTWVSPEGCAPGRPVPQRQPRGAQRRSGHRRSHPGPSRIALSARSPGTCSGEIPATSTWTCPAAFGCNIDAQPPSIHVDVGRCRDQHPRTSRSAEPGERAAPGLGQAWPGHPGLRAHDVRRLGRLRLRLELNGRSSTCRTSLDRRRDFDD